MRTPRPRPLPALRALSALGAALACCACASPDAPRPPRIEASDAGFTITEDVRVGSGLRAEFEESVALLEAGRTEEGIARLEAIAEREPGLTLAHLDLGLAHRERGDLERARASLERALALSPRHPVVLHELGLVARRQGRFDEARTHYERALSLHPDFHYTRRNLAILCDLFLADPHCALEHYEHYVRLVPGDEQVLVWIADLRNRLEERP